jgi:hypothetical protein
MRSKHKQNWINHLEITDNTKLPKHTLNYKPRGRRDRGHPRKRWQRVDSGTDQTTQPMEEDDDDELKFFTCYITLKKKIIFKKFSLKKTNLFFTLARKF